MRGSHDIPPGPPCKPATGPGPGLGARTCGVDASPAKAPPHGRSSGFRRPHIGAASRFSPTRRDHELRSSTGNWRTTCTRPLAPVAPQGGVMRVVTIELLGAALALGLTAGCTGNTTTSTERTRYLTDED